MQRVPSFRLPGSPRTASPLSASHSGDVIQLANHTGPIELDVSPREETVTPTQESTRLEEFCSYFLCDTGLFGKYPTNGELKLLEAAGVSVFVDLTTEKLPEYTIAPSSQHIKYPLMDRRIPYDMENFKKFILRLIGFIKENKKIYIHCRGGHGRAGLTVACLLVVYLGLTSEQAITKTNEAHNQRLVMDTRWRTLGAPQTSAQKTFVFKFAQYVKSPRAANE